MHLVFSSTTSRSALVVAAVLCSPLSAQAASFTVQSGTTTTTQQTVAGTDSGAIQAGGALNVSTTAIIWNGAATGSGVSIVNNGSLVSGVRGIDATGGATGAFLLQNNFGASISSVNDAFRINTAFANGNLTINNIGSIVSQTGQAFDFNAATAASARVSITNTGSITSQGNDAIRLGAGTISIDNRGVIQTTAADSRAISFDADANVETLSSFHLFNAVAGQIIGTDDAIKISAGGANASSATITIENYGAISGGDGQAIDFADLTSANNVINITNYNTGTIQSATADAIRPGAGATVVNFGTIRSTDLTSDGDGVDFQGAGGTVENSGQIIGAKHGVTGDGAVTVTNAAGGLIAGSNGSGVNIDNTGSTLVTINNRGTIRGAATLNIDDDGPGGVPDGIPDGDGDGVDVDGQVNLINNGVIQGTGATGTKDGVANTADSVAAGGGVIFNGANGVIEAFDTVGGGVGRGILIDDSAQGAAPFATTVTNQGIIRADGAAITLIGTQADFINNSGLISSGQEVAVDMGDGSDVFRSNVGSRVVGAVSGGAGSDTLQLDGDGGTFDLSGLSDTGAWRSFETLQVLGAYSATGSSAFAGDLVVDGALRLDGALASADATVRNGGLLSGTGTVGSLSVLSGGAVAPGSTTTGVLTVENGLSFAAGSTYQVKIAGSVADRIEAGTAAISGGSVLVTPVNARVGDVYAIISATSVTGAFDSVSAPSLLFADPALSYSATNVTLSLERNGVAFQSVAQTRNQRSVAAALDGAGAGSDVADYLAGATSASDARASLDRLSAEAHASLGTTLFQQNALVGETLLSRLRQAAAAPGDVRAAALASGGPALAYADSAPVSTAFNDLKAPFSPGAAGPVVATWAQGFGQWSKADGRNGAAKVDGSLGGFLAGADVTSDGLTFGLAGGYVSANSDVDARGAHTDANTAIIAAYAGARIDAVRLRGGASYGWSDVDSRRTVIVGGLNERPKASYDGSTANAFAEAAYALALGEASLEPFAQLAWSRVDTDSFNERNAPVSGLHVGGLDFDTVYTTLGARFATTLAGGAGPITPHASLAWRHAMDDITPDVAARFRNGGGDFTSAGAPIGRNSLLVGAGVDVGIGAGAAIGVAYEGQFASDARYNAVKGHFAYQF